MSHFSSCNILLDTQFGFRKITLPSFTELIKMSHDLAYSLNNKGQTDIVLLDFFSKAFDHLLLTKLQCYGIRGNVLNWISDFLNYC